MRPPPRAESPRASRSLRLRRLVSDNFGLVMLGLVVVLLVNGWLVYTTHIEPGTHLEERSTTLYTHTTGFEHGAVVTAPTSVFPAGSELADRPVYFSAVSPELNGALVTRYQTPHGDPIRVTTRLDLVVRSVDRGQDSETEYWRVAEPLTSAETVTLRPGQAHRTAFAVNVSDVERRIDRIEAELGASVGQPEALVIGEVAFDGRVGGRPVSIREDRTLVIDPGRQTYAVTTDAPETQTVRTTEHVVVPNSFGPVRWVGSIWLTIWSAAAIVGLLLARRAGWLAIDEAEREWLRYVRDRRSNDAWITTGAFPTADLNGSTVAVADLEGLVDVAIDTEGRVIEDLRRQRYVVPTDRFLYTYRPPRGGHRPGRGGDRPEAKPPHERIPRSREPIDAAQEPNSLRGDV